MILSKKDLKGNQILKEEGTFEFKITKFEEVTPQDYCIYKFNCETNDGRYLIGSFFMDEKSLWKFNKLTTALGYTEDMLDGRDAKEVAEELIGKKFNGKVIKKVKNKVNAETGEEEEISYYEISTFDKL